MSLVNVELRAKMIYLLMMWLSSKKSTLIAEQNLFLYAPFHFIVNFDLILGGFFLSVGENGLFLGVCKAQNWFLLYT